MSEATIVEFVRCVTDMRRLQKEYFRTREAAILRECKGCEKHVDDLLKEIHQNSSQMSMF